MYRTAIVLLLAALAASPSTFADRRKYGFTYQSTMSVPDEAELEFYQTTKLDDVDNWEYRIELEHGISSRVDFAVYQIFAQTEGEPFVWDAFQARLRYRLTEPGRVAFDPVLYVEYERPIDLKDQNTAEVKLLLSRDFDRLNLALNPVYELHWAPADPVHEVGLDAGISYEVSPKFSIGAEGVMRREFLKYEEDETAAYFGPCLSYASGPVYYTVSYLAGLTDDANDARVRFLLGVGL